MRPLLALVRKEFATLFGAPTAYLFPLDLKPHAERGWVAEPPAYSLHYWRADSGLVSHTGYADSFGASQEFTD